MNKLCCLFAFLFLMSCQNSTKIKNNFEVNKFDKIYTDASRNREIPVAFYAPKAEKNIRLPVVIFSHGYGRNNPDSNKDYDDLLTRLAEKGYFVASIQHELPTDELLSSEGIPQIVRRPNWDRGAANIAFVLQTLKNEFSYLNFKKVVVSGHSNGGDMSVLFTEKNPEKIWKLITLDQRRYPFPRLSTPKIYSLRSSDQPADEGVLPDSDEQRKLGMTIVKLPNTIHNDMDRSGTDEQKKEIAAYFLKFLHEN